MRTCKDFFIKRGSFCFIIPFFTNVLEKYEDFFSPYQKQLDTPGYLSLSPQEQKKKRKEIINALKGKFVSHLKQSGFPNAQTNFCPDSCIYKSENYQGKYLCTCFSTAAKFHDDISQTDATAQFYLDHYQVKYQKDEYQIEFEFDIFLYINQKEEEKIGYIVIEIDLNNRHPEDLIFIKHLFYKRTLPVTLYKKEGTLLHKEEDHTNMQKWILKYLSQIGKVVTINHKKSFPPYIENGAFRYSLIELQEIVHPITQKPLDLDFNELERIQVEYGHLIYGMLLSDEGWRHIPEKVIKKRLESHWFTRTYICSFFLNTNGLIFNLKHTTKGREYAKYGKDWFKKYVDHNNNKESKYEKYVTMDSCVTGIDGLILFAFLKCIAKQIHIENNHEIITLPKNQSIRSSVKQIYKLQKNLDHFAKILNSPSFKLGEIESMEYIIHAQFGIISQIQQIKEIYQSQSNNLHFQYEKLTNKVIKRLTIYTVMIGAIQLFWAVGASPVGDSVRTTLGQYIILKDLIFYIVIIVLLLWILFLMAKHMGK